MFQQGFLLNQGLSKENEGRIDPIILNKRFPRPHSQRSGRAVEGTTQLHHSQAQVCQNANEQITTCQLVRFAAWIRKTNI